VIELTGAAIDKLRTVRLRRSLDHEHGVRVEPNSEGKLRLMIDAVHGDDLVIEDEGEPLIVVSPDLAERLGRATLDFATSQAEGRGPRFVMRRKRAPSAEAYDE
jgi:hypothetical protein